MEHLLQKPERLLGTNGLPPCAELLEAPTAGSHEKNMLDQAANCAYSPIVPAFGY
jgi:hypothetical protein